MRKRATLTVERVTVGDTTVHNLRVTGPPEYLGGVLHTLLSLGLEPAVEENETEEVET